jgi:hypothetical protein
MPFRTGTLVSSDETSASPSSDSTSTTRKTASGNSRAIQRSDQNLRPFRTRTLVRSAETSSSPTSDSKSTSRKQRLETPIKLGGRSNGRIKSYCPFEPVCRSRAKRPPHHPVVIPHIILGKRRPETPLKILERSNGRIKSYGLLEPGL